jgi:hypothetical protein
VLVPHEAALPSTVCPALPLCLLLLVLGGAVAGRAGTSTAGPLPLSPRASEGTANAFLFKGMAGVIRVGSSGSLRFRPGMGYIVRIGRPVEIGLRAETTEVERVETILPNRSYELYTSEANVGE